jgi:polyvinyl alcohol dehydrogenase (cytochrome)
LRVRPCSSAGATLAIGFVLVAAACGEDEPVSPASAPASNPEWSSFGKDLANTRANLGESRITTETVSGLSRSWAFEAPGITSTPAVAAGIVYFGDWQGTLHARRTADGSEVWKTPIGTPVYASPALANGFLYAGDTDGVVHALDVESGRLEWSTPIFNYQPEVHLGSEVGTTLFGSPVVAGDMLVIGTAAAPYSGAQSFRGNLVGLNAVTGAEKWRLDVTRVGQEIFAPGVSIWSSGAVDTQRGLVYIGTGQSYSLPASPLSDSLLAVDYRTGELVWSVQFTPDDSYTFEVLVAGGAQGYDYDVGAAPNLFRIGERDVVGVGDKSGMYYVVDRDTGAEVWAKELTPGSALGGVMTAAAYAGGKVYVTSNDWKIFGGNVGGILFTDPQNRCHVFALDAEDGGATLWQRDFDSVCIGGVAFAGGVVYVGTTNGRLYALRGADGHALWSDEAGPMGIAGGASVSGGRVFVGHGWRFALGGTTEPLEGGLVSYALTSP